MGYGSTSAEEETLRKSFSSLSGKRESKEGTHQEKDEARSSSCPHNP